MAFMSLMVMWAVFGVVLTGLVILIVGIVLLIVWKVKERKARPVKKRHKILAVVLIIWGAVQFAVPVGLFLGYDAHEKAVHAAELSEVDERINVEDDWNRSDGITVGGVDFVPADYLTAPEYGGEKTAALVYPDGDADYLYTVENEKNYDMLHLYRYVFVPREQADEIRGYYTDEAPLFVTVSFSDEQDEWHEYKADFDINMLKRLSALYDSGFISYKTDDVRQTFYIAGETSDGLYSIWADIDITDKGPILSHISGGGNEEGHMLPDDAAAYISAFTEGIYKNQTPEAG
ncbi:MAG: hypothetical protein IIY34_06540 [Clostridia bacterium]|nr:hypothetical protein [Clostridia bacterium]